MKPLISSFLVVLTGMVFSVSAIDIAFSTPAEWMTLRGDSVLVRFHADTAQLPANQINFRVYRESESSSRRVISRTVTLDSFTGEFNLGSIDEATLGGSQWLTLYWNVPDTDHNGKMGPVGVADLERLENTRIKGATRLADDITLEKAYSQLDEEKYVTVGEKSFALGWNNQSLFVALNKSNGSNSELQFAVDPKVGRSAFLSWADRFLVYNAEENSVEGFHYRRRFSDGVLNYSQRSWGEEIKTFAGENNLVVSIPWHEIGLIPFEERVLGFAVFASENGKRSAAILPSQAQGEIPGTWGDIILEK
ncbi:hypothetical protein CHISP_3675 [Chitinispirillum alkaliphilum]|nr:hypothetical protein CHISP_3675 [Chitinispirillum alkaliphilum]